MSLLQNFYKVIFSFTLLAGTPFIYSVESLESGSSTYSNSHPIVNKAIKVEGENHLANKASRKCKKLSYYLYIQDFINSFIEIPTSNVAVDGSTISSTYLAGRAPLYNKKNKKVGTCSASFLCMQNQQGIYTDISNYLSVDNGLIVSWFTPTTLINLELDSIVRSMITKCIVVASTKVGYNPFFGKTFTMVVSSDDQKIYFKLKKR